MRQAMLLSILLLVAFNSNAAFTAAGSASELDILKDKLKSGVIETLYYGDNDFAAPIRDIIEAKGNEELLFSAYRSLDKDQINLKHTILIVMIKKQQHNYYKLESTEKAKAILVSALTDEHYWIRTEAVCGLRYFGDSTLMRRIAPLVDDKSDFVRKEAEATLVELYELYQDRTDNVF